MSTTTYKKPEPSPAEAEELYKTGARGVQEVQQRVQQEDGAEEEQQGEKEEGEGGRRSRRIKSENHSQRFGKKMRLDALIIFYIYFFLSFLVRVTRVLIPEPL